MIAPLLLGIFEGKSEQEAIVELASLFEVSVDELGIVQLLCAAHESDYNERIWVLFRNRDGSLAEVLASHCSCFGFEQQWSPKPSSIAYLCSRHFSSEVYEHRYAIMQFIERLAQEERDAASTNHD